MVKLNIKKGDESQFLFDTTVQTSIDDLLKELIPIYNGRLKIHRICAGNTFLNYEYFSQLSIIQVKTDKCRTRTIYCIILYDI